MYQLASLMVYGIYLIIHFEYLWRRNTQAMRVDGKRIMSGPPTSRWLNLVGKSPFSLRTMGLMSLRVKRSPDGQDVRHSHWYLTSAEITREHCTQRRLLAN